MFETEDCDSCDAQIVESVHNRPAIHQFALPTGDGDNAEYDTHAFTLCTECRRKIVDWVTDADEAATRVDPIGVESMVTGLDRSADDLQVLADDLRALTQGDHDE